MRLPSCDTHTHMKAYILSFEHPYFAVTDGDGRFAIDQVPPGSYTLKAWHEGWRILAYDQDGRPQYEEPYVLTTEVTVAPGRPAPSNYSWPCVSRRKGRGMRHISRRTFLAMASTLGFGGLQSPTGLYAVAKAYAQPQAPRVVRIAHLSRRQGPDAEMAAYAIMGAQLGAEEADVTAGMFGTRVELIIEDAVTPENVESLTAKLGAQAHLSAIVAALDERTAARVSDATQQQRLVCLNAAARGGVLRGEKCHRLTFHVEPDLAMYTHAMGQWLVHNNRKRWHFVVAESAAEQEVYQRAGRFLQHQGGNDLGRSVITRDSRIIKPCWRSWRVRRPRLSWWHSEARAYGSFWSSTRHRASTFFWRGSRSI